MRKIVAMALTTGFLAGCSTQAMMAVAPKQAAAPAVSSQSTTGLRQAVRHAVSSLFQNADWNHDGFLDANESHNMDSATFAKADKNKDYKLSVSEWLSYYKAQEPQFIQQFRQASQSAFTFADANKDNFVTVDELYNLLNPNPYPPYPDPVVSASPASPYSYGGCYGTGCPGGNDPYGNYTPGYPSGGYDPYPGGYSPSPSYPTYPSVTRQHAATMFNLSDRNRDRKLTPSEFEDLNAWLMASSIEPSAPLVPPTAYPSGTPVTPTPPTPTPTAIPSTPNTATQSLRR
jgi:Ca2+-binding EF-hand superfamily protein